MITLRNTSDYVEIQPFGARVISLHLNGTSVLREDDGTNQKRSGIPILGPLVDATTGIWKEIAPQMPQHGSDRITTWNVMGKTLNSVTLHRTYEGKDHPLIGEATIIISLSNPHVFTLQRTTKNSGDQAVPVGTGLHTYFQPHAVFSSLNIFPLINGKSYHLKGMDEIPMEIGEISYSIESSPTPLETVVWAENSENHICVEPWWAHVGEAPLLEAGESRTEMYRIRSTV